MNERLSISDRVWWFRHQSVPALFRERLPKWMAGVMPRWLVYRVLIRAWARATPGDQHPDETRMIDAIKQWEKQP